MINHKLIRILQTFSKTELSHFKDLVHSPYFNKVQKVKALMDALYATPKWTAESLSKEQLILKVFAKNPKDSKNEQSLRNLFSQLTKLCHIFLFNEVSKDQAIEKNISILQVHKDSPPIVEALLKPTERLVDKSKSHKDYHLYKYKLELIKQFILGKTKKQIPIKSLHKTTIAFDSYFIFNKLLNTQLIIGEALVTGQELPLSKKQTEKFIYYVLDEWQDANPLVIIYAQTILHFLNLDQPPNPTIYQEIKQFINEPTEEYGLDVILELITAWTNYCILKAHRGIFIENGIDYDIDYFFFLHANIQIREKQGINTITGRIYWIYTLGAISANELEMGHEFVEKYYDKLPLDIRDTSYKIAKASLILREKKVEEAHQLLNSIKNAVPRETILIRNLMLKVYFEKNEYLALKGVLESCRIFALRNKDKPQTKQYVVYINTVKRLVQIAEKAHTLKWEALSSKLEQFDQKLEEVKIVHSAKVWLRGKVQDILHQYSPPN